MTVVLGRRMARRSILWKIRAGRLGLGSCWPGFSFSIFMPITGAKSTATNHDTKSAMPTTAKSEKVYSPAMLLERPIGMKPKMVTSVPVSMGKAVEV